MLLRPLESWGVRSYIALAVAFLTLPRVGITGQIL